MRHTPFIAYSVGQPVLHLKNICLAYVLFEFEIPHLNIPYQTSVKWCVCFCFSITETSSIKPGGGGHWRDEGRGAGTTSRSYHIHAAADLLAHTAVTSHHWSGDAALTTTLGDQCCEYLRFSVLKRIFSPTCVEGMENRKNWSVRLPQFVLVAYYCKCCSYRKHVRY